MKRMLVSIASFVAASLPGLAGAESPFSHEPGPTAAVATQAGLDVDEAEDFEGAHPMFGVVLGYRFATGTEPFVAGSLGAGGHEAAFLSYAIGVRQRIRFGILEPFVELGLGQVSDNSQGPLALVGGGGLDVRITPTWSAGAAAGHYVSDDVFTGGYGSLDWYARGQITFRFGR